jgi:hypothetical protein
MIMKTITISIFVLYCSLLSSQTTEKTEKSYWLNSGLGIYCAPQSAGFVWNVISLQQINRTKSWKIKLMYSEELNLFGPSPSEHFYEAGFLTGRVSAGNVLRVSLHGGLGFTGGTTRGDYMYTEPVFFGASHYEKKDFFTLGIPVEAGIRAVAVKNSLELGFTAHANLNTIASQFGITMNIFIHL